jgi:hypothetical protein
MEVLPARYSMPVHHSSQPAPGVHSSNYRPSYQDLDTTAEFEWPSDMDDQISVVPETVYSSDDDVDAYDRSREE